MNQQALDTLYMDIAARVSQESKAIRAKVGAVIVKDLNIVSYGWNGTPSSADNCCEIEVDGQLITKPTVLHAELNAVAKIAKYGGEGLQDSTLYVTLSPCVECCKLLAQTGISKVIYRDHYRDTSGITLLKDLGVVVQQYENT